MSFAFEDGITDVYSVDYSGQAEWDAFIGMFDYLYQVPVCNNIELNLNQLFYFSNRFLFKLHLILILKILISKLNYTLVLFICKAKSIILFEYPHSLSYQDITLTNFGLSIIPA